MVESDPKPLPYLLTEDEAAELLEMSPSNLRQRRRRRVGGESGVCPAFIRMGRRIRYLSAAVESWGDANERWSGEYSPDHRCAGQFGIEVPEGAVLTDAQVCAVLRISVRDARDLRSAAMSGYGDAYPPFSREVRSIVVRRSDLVGWVESLAQRNESLESALDRRAS